MNIAVFFHSDEAFKDPTHRAKQVFKPKLTCAGIKIISSILIDDLMKILTLLFGVIKIPTFFKLV